MGVSYSPLKWSRATIGTTSKSKTAFAIPREREIRYASISLPSAVESFALGWEDMLKGRTHPLDTLWEGIDAE